MKGIPGYLFGNPVSQYLGRISYGLYLYHIFIPDFSRWLLDTLGIGRFSEGIMWIIYTFLTLLITSISWLAFEQPINKLKDRFSYGK
jgi:peptidoglycan/LPS O-acetylase OafA/YrhL